MPVTPSTDVRTAPLAALGLVGGYLVARESGIRWLGGVLLGAVGLYCGRSWLVRDGAGTTAALSAIYLGAFGLSHPLAKRIGAWPAVLGAAALSSGASWALSDARQTP